MKYIALLRGINVGGKNKVPMAELKRCFVALGFDAVQTYINSGNVLFETEQTSTIALTRLCESAIEAQFGFSITCSVYTQQELVDALAHAPSWWGIDSESSHNAMFVIAPATAASIIDAVGATNPEYEKLASYGSIIFWSAPVKTFGRTRFSKIVGTPAYKSITIRNANTTRKLATLNA